MARKPIGEATGDHPAVVTAQQLPAEQGPLGGVLRRGQRHKALSHEIVSPLSLAPAPRASGATRTPMQPLARFRPGSAKTARERGGWELAKDSLVARRETAQMPKSELGGYLGYSCLWHRCQQRSSHEMNAPLH